MSTQLGQIAKKAKLDRQVRFTSLAHLLTPAFLKDTWRMINRKAASGIDGESTEQFAGEMEERVEEICKQLRAGTYRAPRPTGRNTQGSGQERHATVRDPHCGGPAVAASGCAHTRGCV
jgi:hypothetical protein